MCSLNALKPESGKVTIFEFAAHLRNRYIKFREPTKQDSVRSETPRKDDVFDPIGAKFLHLLGDQPPRESSAAGTLWLPLRGRAVLW